VGSGVYAIYPRRRADPIYVGQVNNGTKSAL
jgi:hypothetical protein